MDLHGFRKRFISCKSLMRFVFIVPLVATPANYVNAEETGSKESIFVAGELKDAKKTTLNLENLKIEAQLLDKEGRPTIGADFIDTSVAISLSAKGREIYSTNSPVGGVSTFGQRIEAVRLLESTEYPQVVVKRYTGGAHCCTTSMILTQDEEGTWQTIEGQAIDGNSGYTYRDLDGDGTLELIAADQSFYYLFSAYSESYPPMRIYKLTNSKLEDVSADPKYVPAFLKELDKLETAARKDPTLWASNGFIAGWAAVKARVGQAAEALKQAADWANTPAEFHKRICPDGSATSACGYDNGVDMPFSVGLTIHLIELGYLSTKAIN